VLAIGLGLQLKLTRDELKPLAAGLGLKLFLMPLLALGLAPLLGLGGAAHDTVVLESAMPPMITAAALTGRAGSMRAHLSTAAVSLDNKAQIISGFYAHRLAEDWRRALVIAERTRAKIDKLAAPSCGTGS
jgi:predicted permease